VTTYADKNVTDDHVVLVTNADGRVLSEFDFLKLKIDASISLVLARAMAALFGHTTLETQRQAWRCIRKFVICNQELGLLQSGQVPPDALLRFKVWLDESNLAGSTKQSQFNIVAAVLTWCSRNYPETVSKKLRTNVGYFVRGKVKPREFLEEGSIKKILSACYSDIEAIEKKMELGRRMLAGEVKEPLELDVSSLIRELLELGGGRIPTQPVINRSKNAYSRRVIEAGGLRYLNSLIMLSPTDMFPFYLAILAQTSGNPMAIHSLNRDCVHPHSFRSDLVMVRWEKGRSASEQMVDFPAGREWSAASLIKRLARLNENLLLLAEPSAREKLFIAYSHQQARIPCFQMFHHLLKDFVMKHQLEVNFDFKDLRRAGANAHQKNGSSIFLAKKRLNHKSFRTTARYLNQVEVSEAHEQTIVRFQGELWEMAMAPVSRTEGLASKIGQIPSRENVDTVFGFQCKDPLGGIAKGSKKGELCEQFFRCATCPGALIILDDTRIVARLLRARDELLAAKERSVVEGWWPRFETYYLPSLRILETEIFPAIAPDILAKAAAASVVESLPRLE
jgi:hypothetical protein